MTEEEYNKIVEGHRKERERQKMQHKAFYGEPKSKAVSKTLDKARGGMIGNLKRTMRDKDLKKDHYQTFKNQHNIK